MKTIAKENIYKTIVAFETATGKTVNYSDNTTIKYDVIHRTSVKSGKWFNTSEETIHTFDHDPSDEEFKNVTGRLRAVWLSERQEDVIELSDKQFFEIESWKNEQAVNKIK